MKKFISLITVLLLLISAIPLSAFAAETTSKAMFSYLRSGSWKSFNGTVTASNYMDGIKIQTDSNKSYYLSYRTWNENQTGYFSDVKSTVNDYAGSSKSLRMIRLGISVKNKSDNSSITSGIVVMYRVLVNGIWLPWVSNADPEWMAFVQRKYGLDGTLDYKSGYAGIDGSFITGVEIHIYEESEIENSVGAAGVTKLIDAPYINQTGSYPTGCESVSTVMALNYLGIGISADNFIDSYLPKGSADSFDPNLCFGGDPRSESGMGCYAPVIETAATAACTGLPVTVARTDGLSLSRLCEDYIDDGIPVILWATQGMQKASTGKKITYNGKAIQWISPEHCLLLVGYDENNYIFNDPLESKNIAYSRNAVENAYYALGAQAVIITPDYPEAVPAEGDFTQLPQSGEGIENINTSGGSFKAEIELLRLSDNLSLSAYYCSDGLLNGQTGIGWYNPFEKRLENTGEEIRIYENPSFYSTFVLSEDNIYRSATPGREAYTLTTLSDGSYRLDFDDTAEYYDSLGRLSGINKKQALILITYSEGSVEITDSTGQSIILCLDSMGRAILAQSGEKSVSFTYTAGLLTGITVSDGKTYTLSYDTDFRLSHLDSNGSIINITYNSYGKPATLTRPDGGISYYFYDENAALIKAIYPLKGDVNIDGCCDILDYIRLKKHLSDPENNTVSEYNSNFDGEDIAAADLIELKKLLLIK